MRYLSLHVSRRRIAARMLERLRPIADMMQTSRYKFYASSVLLIYEGAEYIRVDPGDAKILLTCPVFFPATHDNLKVLRGLGAPDYVTQKNKFVTSSILYGIFWKCCYGSATRPQSKKECS